MIFSRNLRVKFIILNLLVLLFCFGMLGISINFFIRNYLFTALKTDFLERTQVIAIDIWPTFNNTQKNNYITQWNQRFPETNLYWARNGILLPTPDEFDPIKPMLLQLLSSDLTRSGVMDNRFRGDMVAYTPVVDGVLILVKNRFRNVPDNFFLIIIVLITSFVLISVLFLYPPTNKIIVLIQDLKKLASKVAQGSFGEKINTTRSDELGELVESFNHMSLQLAEVEQQNQILIAGVSHELRSPLTRIRVNAEQLELSATMRDVVPHSHAICKEVDHMDSIVSDLLSSVRMRKESVSVHKETTNLNEFLEKIIQLYHTIIPPEKVHIDYQSQQTSLNINIDVRMIKQVLTNIIDNAITAINQNGIISIKLHTDSKFAVIGITDDGPGIDPQHQKLIFERFYRIDASRTRRTGGVGLGLTIVKQIIDVHDGKIELSSKAGEGSTFSIFLPLS